MKRALLICFTTVASMAQAFAGDDFPKPVITNSNATSGGIQKHVEIRFTTKAYEQAALSRVIEEANRVALDLGLNEALPITLTNLTQAFIAKYGMSQLAPYGIGAVHTRNYGYFVAVDHKLSFIDAEDQAERCLHWLEDYHWPLERLDTTNAFGLATQWLAAASMDVVGLNRECTIRVEPNSYWNHDLRAKGEFVPIYDVFWISPKNKTEGSGDAAFVSLFAPTKTLISLRVRDSKYILRKPLVFTNLAELLSDTNTLSGH